MVLFGNNSGKKLFIAGIDLRRASLIFDLTGGGNQAFTDVYSMDMDGISQYADAGTPPGLDFEWNQPMWMGAWVYLRSTHPTVDHGRMAIIGKSFAINETPSHMGFHLICMDNNVGDIRQAMLYIITSYPSPAHYMGAQLPNYSIPLNQWFRLDAASLDGTFANVKMWLNGVPQTLINEADNAGDSLVGTASKFTVGSHNGFASFVDGMIDEPLIANFYPEQSDIDKVNSLTPFDASTAAFTDSIVSTWRMGDEDTAPTVKDRKSTNDLTLINGASFVNKSPFVLPTINLVWTPSAADGDLALWIDPTDNTKITTGTGVASITDKSANGYVYSQATGATQPTLGSLNGLQCLVGNGSQYLNMESSTRILGPNNRFIIGIAAYCGTSSGFPSIFQDGEGTNEATILGFTATGGYSDIFFGSNDGVIFRTNYVFGLTLPQQADFVIEHLNQIGNDETAYRATVAGVTVNAAATGSFGSNAGVGRLLAALTGNAFTGKAGDFVIIKDPSASDILNLKAFLTRRWGQ